MQASGGDENQGNEYEQRVAADYSGSVHKGWTRSRIFVDARYKRNPRSSLVDIYVDEVGTGNRGRTSWGCTIRKRDRATERGRESR